MSKVAYPLKLPLSIKKAAERSANEDGVSLKPMDRSRGGGKSRSGGNGGRILQEARRKRLWKRAYEVLAQRA